MAIVLPCHRVVGANASLTDYAGGLERKRWLLRHEGKILEKGGEKEIRTQREKAAIHSMMSIRGVNKPTEGKETR